MFVMDIYICGDSFMFVLAIMFVMIFVMYICDIFCLCGWNTKNK
jgi:hypothetical protein